MPPPPAPGQLPPQPAGAAPELSLNFGAGKAAPTTAAPAPPRGVSAPTSPAKSRESLLQRVQSLTGAARDQGASILGAAVQSATQRAPAFNKDRYFTLLVLDDQNTDWSKYFRGRRLHGDFDIRVEQAEFRDITVVSSADTGPVVTMAAYRSGTRVARSFRPDFVLIRQPPRDGSSDFRSTILGLKYGGVPSINSLHSIYQFQDKPWVFSHLLQLQRRLGRDGFPLIEQTFFPNPRDLFQFTKFPSVLKAGHCHGGVATARLENQSALQDAAGLVSGAGNESHCYCTIEPYIDAKFSVHIQKIGNNYKAFMRKSITGNWKTNQGSAMLEQITLTEKYKTWVDEISELFGGMEVCGVSVVVAKDGREHIISACDSTFALIGDSQEEDRRQIADLVSGRMQNVCRPNMAQTGPGKLPSRSSVSSRAESPTEDMAPTPPLTAGPGPRPAPMGGPPPIPERTSPAVGSIGRLSSRSSISELPEEPSSSVPSTVGGVRRDSQTSLASSVSTASRAGQRPPQTQSSEIANKKRGRTASETSNSSGLGSVPSSAGPASSVGSGSGFSGSFLGKQFSFAASGSKSSGVGGGIPDVISTQPSRPQQQEPATTTAAVPASDSATTDNITTTTTTSAGYQPVTNFEPQERVNPFDKDASKSMSVTSMGAVSNTTSSSSSISSSSISSRINRNGNPNKSPPPPTGPPPPPPHVTANANFNTNNSSSASASAYRNSFSSSLSKDKTSYGNYDSNSSVETITRMDTNTTNTTAITATGGSEAITAISSGGAAAAITSSTSNNDWRTAIGMRSASVYSAPAAVTTTAPPGDTSGYDSNSLASQAGYNNPSDLPSYTRPSYSRSESNASKQSDLDIIFGDIKPTPAVGNGKYTRSGGSISDADMMFGGPTASYKSDRFGASKSMSMSSSGAGASSNTSYKIYEGIQNAAFSDYSDTGSMSSLNSTTKRWSAKAEDDDELDLK
ncbi:Syn [Drosophila busckii]|uniref:Syn n=1 Tax=Drosophila busckii TaxID=30019 RepID=A0A0M4EV14_DROBS|nr:Syn [Drosophila busckii]